MGPAEFLDALDHGIAVTRRGRQFALRVHLNDGQLLGERGRYLGEDETRRPVFGFNRRQCQRMRKVILDAAAADLAAENPDD